MDTTGLSRGNLLSRKKDGLICTVKGVLVESILYINPDLSNVKTTGSRISNFEGIPLTDEWLLKLGFEKTLVSKNDLGIVSKWRLNNMEVVEHYETPGFAFESLDAWLDYQHVHQLQNLYFALTNEELTIK